MSNIRPLLRKDQKFSEGGGVTSFCRISPLQRRQITQP